MRKAILIAMIFCLMICCISPVVYANAPGPNLDGTYVENPAVTAIIIGLFVLLYLGLTAFTCWMEWLISGPFGFRPTYQKTILITNLITQLSMHVLEFIFMNICPRLLGDITDILQWYLLTELILEVLVYVSEFLIYRKKMQDISSKRILLYTVCANTASLLGGILLLMILI